MDFVAVYGQYLSEVKNSGSARRLAIFGFRRSGGMFFTFSDMLVLALDSGN